MSLVTKESVTQFTILALIDDAHRNKSHSLPNLGLKPLIAPEFPIRHWATMQMTHGSAAFERLVRTAGTYA